MKIKHKIIPIALLALSLTTACSDDKEDVGVKIDPPTNGFTFKPAPGGSIMHYTLPDNDQITGVSVSYVDEYGRTVRCSGSATCDSVELVGFNNAQDKVDAQVEYIMRDQSKSAPIDVTFSTLNSAPVEFLNSVNALSNWGGFSLSFKNDAEAKGMVHVFYLGIDPLSQKADTILMNSFYLEKDTVVQYKNYRMQQNVGDKVTIVVRTEDFRGNMVGEKSWNDVPLLEEKLINWGTDFDFFCDRIVTDEIGKTGIQYLFDGDKTGVSQTKEENFINVMYSALCTFIAGPNAFGDDAAPWYVDLKRNRVVANIKMYAMQDWWDYQTSHYIDNRGYYCDAGYYVSDWWERRTPCEVTVYALKDNGTTPTSYEDFNPDDDNWVKLGYYYQSPSLSYKDRYCPHVSSAGGNDSYYTFADMQNAVPEYLEVVCPAAEQGEGYRYLKIVINDTFALSANTNGNDSPENKQKYVIVQEMEINTAKD